MKIIWKLAALALALAIASPAQAAGKWVWCRAKVTNDGQDTQYYSAAFFRPHGVVSYVPENDWSAHVRARYGQPTATNCLGEDSRRAARRERDKSAGFYRRMKDRVVITEWRWSSY